MIKLRSFKLSIYILCLALFCPLASAEVQEEIESAVPKRQLEIDKAVRDASREALIQKDLETDEIVTYEQILDDPDNIPLNFRYAKSQVREGNLVSASATLERILLVNPNLPRVRLFRALVLLRLDDMAEAERELKRLKSAPMPDELRAQIKNYLNQIRLSRKSTRFSTSFTTGFAYDSNRNAAPSGKERLVLDTPTGLTGTSKKRRDTSFLVIHSFEVEHDLGFQTGHKLTGSLNYYLGEQTVADDLDIESFSGQVAPIINTPLATLTPKVSFSNLLLSRETYLRSTTLGMRAEKALGKRLSLFADGNWSDENYLGIVENQSSKERDGDKITVEVGATVVLRPTMTLTSRMNYENKYAKRPYNAYEGFTFSNSHVWILGKGQFLVNSLDFTVNGYEEADPAISVRTRRDEQLRYRILYGAPVTFLLGLYDFPSWMTKDLTATISFEQFRSHSSIPNYSYSNSKLSTMLIKRLNF